MRLTIAVIALIIGGVLFNTWLFNDSRYKELFTINKDLYYHPDPDEIDLRISLDTIAGDGIEGLTKRELLVEMGKTLLHKRTGQRRSSCADCHSEKNAGTGFTNKTPGGGEFRGFYNDLYEKVTGRESLVEEDRKPFKNRSNLNAYKLHDSGKILAAGKMDSFVLEMQVNIAIEDAHFMNDLLIECSDNDLFNQIAFAISGKKFDMQVLQSALSAYQQTLTTSNNKINQHIRNPDVEIVETEGFKLFIDKCEGCHMGDPKMHKSFIDDAILDSVLVLRLDLNNKDHTGYFHNSTNTTLYKAIQSCDKAHSNGDELGWFQIYRIRRFINNNLYDKNYTT